MIIFSLSVFEITRISACQDWVILYVQWHGKSMDIYILEKIVHVITAPYCIKLIINVGYDTIFKGSMQHAPATLGYRDQANRDQVNLL